MRILVFSDIYGATNALDELTKALPFEAHSYSPYSPNQPDLIQQKQAYQYFIDNVGIEHYSNIVRHQVEQEAGPVHLLGFSVGASAIWHMAEDNPPDNIVAATGYYGGQIRNMLSIKPQFPINLVFPGAEVHFSVSQVMQSLAQTPNVSLRQVAELHGFMSKLSEQFCAQAYQRELKWLAEGFK